MNLTGAKYLDNLIKKLHICMWDLIIIAVTIVVRISYYANMTVLWAGDSDGYVNYTWFYVRTPAYPLIIDFFQFVAGDNYIYPLIVFQIIISFVSALIFVQTAYYVIRIITKKISESLISIICRAVFVVYAFNPSLFVWDMSILTESLAISSTVVFIYFVVKFLYKKKAIDGVCMVVISFLTMMIRPASQILFLDIILFIVILVFNKKFRRILCSAIVSVIVFAILTLTYMGGEYEKNGTFQLTNLKPRHDMVKVLQSGLYLNNPDKELVENIKELYRDSEWLDIVVYRQELMDLFGDNIKEANINMNEFNAYCVKTDVPAYIGHLNNLFCNVIRWKFVPYANSRDELFSLNVSIDRWQPVKLPWIFSWTRFLSMIYDEVSVIQVLLTGIILFVLFIVYMIGKKEMAYLFMGISGGILSILISTVIGTFSEFGRCLVEILPFYYIGILSLATIIINWIVEKESNRGEARVE